MISNMLVRSVAISRIVGVWFVALVVACGPKSTGPTGPSHGPNEALAGLPPPSDQPLHLDDDDDLDRARGSYEALAETDPGRVRKRAELWTAYARHIDLSLEQREPSEALAHFATAISMWSPADLADETKPAPGLADLVPTATRLLDVASRAGLDVDAVTAIAVLRAADPSRAAALEAAFDEVASYADDLEVARFEAGAEGARPIKILETVSARFPSPWACQSLADLYVARQKARVQSLGQNDRNMEGAHGPSIRTPVWNVIRAYARMNKLEAAAAVADGFAGQIGDDEDVRAALRGAYREGGNPDQFGALAGFFAGAADDLLTARRICEAGVRRFPKAAGPLRCLGVMAAQGGSLPLALSSLERAYALDQDEQIGSILATLYHFEIGDLLNSERPTAAQEKLAKAEAFHAALAKRFPKKPPERGLDDLYLTYGRGLYALGEIDAAATFLNKAIAQKQNPEALELLGTIAHKRGRLVEAARIYEEAAKLPRETPLEQTIDEARLLRLAAEARAESGDAAGARTWFGAAMEKWDRVLGSGLTERQRVEALTERGRILWTLGQRDDGLRSFEAAVDTAGRASISAGFSDTIAFLYLRGALPAALDAYHRGLGRAALSENMKIYASLWVVYGARLRGEAPDPLAMDYLGSRQGSRWYHLLARYAAGQLSWKELYAQAQTRGRRAEAYFYRGLERYAAGDQDEGHKLMRWVVATDMLGFFEYDMALVIMREGIARP
jgi:tetratricopeptide (TPR) repeat protein